ncbi:hypothetical protein SUGI_0199300 [Cryptomeria japonica]|nr:hypothetical protein SUGI_0199300 [Cryptomeria japonica]
MDSCTVKSVTASWHVMFLLLLIFLSEKSIGARSGVDKGSLLSLASPAGILSDRGSFERIVSGNVRKLRGRGPLVPPTPKSNGNVSYKTPPPPS